MPPATLQRQSHYYAVFPHFGAFKESMTLNFAQRSFKVLHIGESQCMTSYRPLIVTFALSATVSEIVYCRFVLYAASHFFHTPLYNAGRDMLSWYEILPGSTEDMSVAVDVCRYLLSAKSDTVFRLWSGRRRRLA